MQEKIIIMNSENRYVFKLPDGNLLIIDASDDKNYPGIDIELISIDGKNRQIVTRPRILIEKPFNENTNKYENLRALVWANSQEEDYSGEIEFEI